jgi:hypothetical protein
MAYDDAGRRVLLFGGFAAVGSTLRPMNDLWAWDGQRWTLLGIGGPSARGDFLAVWDATRRRLVVYGGANDAGLLGDTWEWDGTTWTQRATGGPTLRRHFSGGYDRRRGRVVLAGGLLNNTDTPAGDTWEWDGATWTQRATTSPSTLTATSRAMAYSETRGALFMLAGSFSTAPSALWQWNGSTWTNVSPGPTAPMPLPLVESGDDEITTLLANGTTLRWRGSSFDPVATSGPAVDGAAIAFDRARNRLVLFGGLAGQTLSADTWLWNGTAWSRVAP